MNIFTENSTLYTKKGAMIIRPEMLTMFVLFDLLFLPRILILFGIPASLLVIVYILLRSGLGQVKLLLFMSVACICFFSVVNGFFVKGDAYLIDDIKRVLQLLTSILYGLIILNYSFTTIYKYTIIMRIFFLWLLFNVLIFILSPDFYHSIINNFYPEALESIEDNIAALRFSYFFADPNSAAYFICFAVFLYCSIEKNRSSLTISLICAAASILVTQSRGGIVALMCILIYVFSCWNLSISRKFLLLACVGVILFPVVYEFSYIFENAYEIYELRNKAEEALDLGIGGGRIQKYQYFFANLNIFPIGVGYSLLKDGVEFRPHSDLIRINFSYGLPLLAFIIYIVYPRSKNSLVLFIIFMIAFLINTIIDDYKLLPLYLFTMNFMNKLQNFAGSRLS
jgi:hypothetical protein